MPCPFDLVEVGWLLFFENRLQVCYNGVLLSIQAIGHFNHHFHLFPPFPLVSAISAFPLFILALVSLQMQNRKTTDKLNKQCGKIIVLNPPNYSYCWLSFPGRALYFWSTCKTLYWSHCLKCIYFILRGWINGICRAVCTFVMQHSFVLYR